MTDYSYLHDPEVVYALQKTWRVQHPQPGKAYQCWFIVVVSPIDEVTVFDWDIPNLGPGRTQWQDIFYFAIDQDYPHFGMFRFDGTYLRRNGQTDLTGKLTALYTHHAEEQTC